MPRPGQVLQAPHQDPGLPPSPTAEAPGRLAPAVVSTLSCPSSFQVPPRPMSSGYRQQARAHAACRGPGWRASRYWSTEGPGRVSSGPKPPSRVAWSRGPTQSKGPQRTHPAPGPLFRSAPQDEPSASHGGIPAAPAHALSNISIINGPCSSFSKWNRILSTVPRT